jgi:predicted membrane metal-binding protein
MISSEELAKTTPVNPPIVNKNTNPRAHIIGASKDRWALNIVAIHLNTFTPVGMAMIIVAAVKYARVSMSIPTVNMWCAHTINPRNPMDTIA